MVAVAAAVGGGMDLAAMEKLDKLAAASLSSIEHTSGKSTNLLSGVISAISSLFEGLKPIVIGLKMIGKLISALVTPFALIFMPLFILLTRLFLPILKVLYSVLMPLLRKQMENISKAVKAGKGGVELANIVLFETAALITQFVVLMFSGVIAEILKGMNDIAFAVIEAFTIILLSALGLQSAIGPAIQSLELLRLGINTALDLGVKFLIEKITGTGDAAKTTNDDLTTFQSAIVTLGQVVAGVDLSQIMKEVNKVKTEWETIMGDTTTTVSEKSKLIEDSFTNAMTNIGNASKEGSYVQLALTSFGLNIQEVGRLAAEAANKITETWRKVQDIYKSLKEAKTKIEEPVKKGVEQVVSTTPIGIIGKLAMDIDEAIRTAAPAQNFLNWVKTGKHTEETRKQEEVGDFIMRPGQPAVSFSPNDTIIGSTGGSAGGVTIQNMNVYAQTSDPKDLVREISKELQFQLRSRSMHGMY